MKLSRLLSSGMLALTMSLGVTAGSIYVVVSTAAANSASTAVEDLLEPAPDPLATVPSARDRAIEESESGAYGKSGGYGQSDVELTSDGSLTARIAGVNIRSGELEPSAGVEVTLISAGGAKITTTTDDDGFCAFGGVNPGLYTINAAGAQGRLSYGVRAVSSHSAVATNGDDSEPLPVAFNVAATSIESALTPTRDAKAIQSVISSVTVTPVDGAAASSGGAAMETAYAEKEELIAHTESSAVSAEDASRSYIDYQPRGVHLNLDGSLEGQLALHDPRTGNTATVRDLTVSFISDDEVVATTTVNPDGSFVQWNLLPGVYSMVVAGSDGIGYVGIDVVENGQVQLNQPGHALPTAVLQPTPFSFGLIQGTGAGEGDGTGDESEDDLAGALPFGAAGGGTGGGGTGGGGGFGSLLGLAGLAAAGAALADGNNNRNPASPGN